MPFEDQIILIDNPKVFDGYTPYCNPFKTNRVRRVIEEVRRLCCSILPHGKLGHLRSNKIFVGYFDRSFDSLDLLHDLFAEIEKHPQTQFEVLVGKGDYILGEELSDKIPENVDALFINNMNIDNSRLRYLPMGRDFRSIDVFKNRTPCNKKKSLCYCNFSVSTHPVRQQIPQMIEDKPFILKQHLGDFLNYSITREEFFDTLESSKYCICPRGNAFDTFRMWDSLYSGTIPIVVREAVYHDLLDDLPILFLDGYEEIEQLNEAMLESKYDEMLDTKFNFEKLTASWWLKK